MKRFEKGKTYKFGTNAWTVKVVRRDVMTFPRDDETTMVQFDIGIDGTIYATDIEEDDAVDSEVAVMRGYSASLVYAIDEVRADEAPKGKSTVKCRDCLHHRVHSGAPIYVPGFCKIQGGEPREFCEVNFTPKGE